MSGKTDEFINGAIVQLQTSRLGGSQQRQLNPLPLLRHGSVAQAGFSCLQQQALHRAPLSRRPGLEAAIEQVRYVNGCPHGTTLPYLWQAVPGAPAWDGR